jgi:hypothetical protein
MIKTNEIFVVVKKTECNIFLYKDALFTKEEAEIEKTNALNETGTIHEVRRLEDHLEDLVSNYQTGYP